MAATPPALDNVGGLQVGLYGLALAGPPRVANQAANIAPKMQDSSALPTPPVSRRWRRLARPKSLVNPPERPHRGSGRRSPATRSATLRPPRGSCRSTRAYAPSGRPASTKCPFARSRLTTNCALACWSTRPARVWVGRVSIAADLGLVAVCAGSAFTDVLRHQRPPGSAQPPSAPVTFASRRREVCVSGSRTRDAGMV